MDEGVVLEDNVEKLSARCFCPMVQVGVFLQEGVAQTHCEFFFCFSEEDVC